MPARNSEIDEFRSLITDLYRDGLTEPAIINEVFNQTGNRFKMRTLQRRRVQWGLARRQVQSTITTADLRSDIQYFFYNHFPSDKTLLRLLRSIGHVVNPAGLRRIRKSLGLYKKHSKEEIERAKQSLVAYFQGDKTLEQTVRSQGRKLNAVTVRLETKVLLPIAASHDLIRELYPQDVKARQRRFQQHKGGFVTPGPDYIWCVDGYLKMRFFGFEIYAAIDAYSRFIVWAHCGISATTQRGVYSQYLTTLATNGRMPWFMRSDRGMETLMMAQAHCPPDLPNAEPHTCYNWTTSTENQRIEHWWRQWNDSSCKVYNNLFRKMREDGTFVASNDAHRVAILYIYMPVIRDKLAKFVQVWNKHPIYPDPRRPHLCASFMDGVTFAATEDVIEAPQFLSYTHLRKCLEAHAEAGTEPRLHLLPAPTGAYKWDAQ
ncbi:hypothetical protein B0T16DRAFT_432760 [Cercophora newfieldiana]|uniref:Integrase core domain-containing protein n=1 Tax=Cercophora newfieldiana TaxID=92897 RepID=A0AA39YMR8_9PEZI|nr:hypothetical protein B0T16DRAFT_432760 [Cercophora newfieldiana]